MIARLKNILSLAWQVFIAALALVEIGCEVVDVFGR